MNETTRLYYTDARLTDFTSQVEAIEWHATAGAICLEATAFYPTSGGQPHDTGSMGDQRVVDVVVRPDGRVWHPLDAVPAVVVGVPLAQEGRQLGGPGQGRARWRILARTLDPHDPARDHGDRDGIHLVAA